MTPQDPQSFFPVEKQRRFRKKLLSWYDVHRRDLPWRSNRDPYRVWISEIMLQQTRVAAVIAHYHEFLRRFPTVQKLAAAREASVLAAWSGLGYYRRARMMHAAAKVIVREHGGQFPATTGGLRDLPGIGRYTAAAIASITFGEVTAVVDGNVERVLVRLLGQQLAREALWQGASQLLDGKRPGDFNQAMMELGAVVCTPRAPACLTCPVVELCATRGELAVAGIVAPQRKCEIHFVLNVRGGNRAGEVFLVQRALNASLMAGMWELPEVTAVAANGCEQQVPFGNLGTGGAPSRSASRRDGRGLEPLFTLRHSITVTDYSVTIWPGRLQEKEVGEWVRVSRLKKIALTGLARKILRTAKIL